MKQPIKIGSVSGKGGTGKTTISLSLGMALSKIAKVGILDIDLTGPNITDALGMKELVIKNDRFVPTRKNGDQIRYISLGQIASEGDPILWSGKNLKSAAKQLFERTDWGDIEYLVVDFPPGSGSETQAVLPEMDYALIVTVPSVLAHSNVQRMVEMCRELQIPILGLIKNMAHFQCPTCDTVTNIFPEDHSFEAVGIPTLVEIPLLLEVATKKYLNHFPIEPVLNAMKTPVILPLRKPSIKRRLIEYYMKLGGKTK